MAVRVATMNLWGWYHPVPERGRIGKGDPSSPPPAWSARQRVLRDGLRALAPDLVTCQEAIATAGQVAGLLGPGYTVVDAAEREPDGSTVSIASRWPLLDVREVGLHVTPRTAGFPCVALMAEVETPVGRVLLVNHLPNFQLDMERERELQAVAVARAIEEAVGGRDLHVVLAGDLDAGPDQASIRFLRGRQSLEGMSVCYRDAWEHVHGGEPGHTFTPANPMVGEGTWPMERGRRIDHIMVRCADHGPTLDITGCERIFDHPVEGVWASDHFGVVADLDTI
jgi:endonuclease/exonuclease/phosphatase family metal-dependent hydrolase